MNAKDLETALYYLKKHLGPETEANKHEWQLIDYLTANKENILETFAGDDNEQL